MDWLKKKLDIRLPIQNEKDLQAGEKPLYNNECGDQKKLMGYVIVSKEALYRHQVFDLKHNFAALHIWPIHLESDKFDYYVKEVGIKIVTQNKKE